MRRLISVLCFAFLVSPVSASVDDYCAAYARDFADSRGVGKPAWQQHFDNAEKSCLTQYSKAEAVAPKAKVKTKVVVKVTDASKRPEKPKLVEKPKVQEPENKQITAVQKPAVVAAKTVKLEPGSPEWIDYCTRKYTSFDAKKGTYLSRTGVERKCLITADFK
jgi:hypothetical protein